MSDAWIELLNVAKNVERELDVACRTKILGSTWTNVQIALKDAIRAVEDSKEQ